MKSALVVVAAMAVSLGARAACHFQGGVWMAELNDDTLQMTLMSSRHGAQQQVMGFEETLPAFAGLSRADLLATAADVQFTLRRPAGTISFEGRVAGGAGAGRYHFAPDANFTRAMDALGYRGLTDEQMLMFAVYAFDLQVLRDLRSMGYQPTQQEMAEIAVLRITADALRGFASFRATGI